nr:hypothetical protein BgiMline_003511 [Biomphalaria glabrata]
MAHPGPPVGHPAPTILGSRSRDIKWKLVSRNHSMLVVPAGNWLSDCGEFSATRASSFGGEPGHVMGDCFQIRESRVKQTGVRNKGDKSGNVLENLCSLLQA